MTAPLPLDTVLQLFADPSYLSQVQEMQRDHFAQKTEKLVGERVALAGQFCNEAARQHKTNLLLEEEADAYEETQRKRCVHQEKKVAELQEAVQEMQRATAAQKAQNHAIRGNIDRLQKTLDSLDHTERVKSKHPHPLQLVAAVVGAHLGNAAKESRKGRL